MATEGAAKVLCEEVTCPICLEYFEDPVIIPECGHNFCRACLISCWGESEGEASCPQCREQVQHRDIVPNRALANVVGIAKKLSLQGREGAAGKRRVCEKHQEPVKLHCKEDEAPICGVCDGSKEHERHKTTPLAEALQEHKVSQAAFSNNKSSAMPCAPGLVDVEVEAKCPICMEYLTDPVTLDCGHNFCQGCISDYCEIWEDLGDLECPVCKAKLKKGNFRTNWQLANIVEKIRDLPLNPGKETVCKRHNENLTQFCKDDEKLLCSVCAKSLEHRAHTVLPLEEAAQEYKGQISSFLEILRKEREEIPASAADTGKQSQELLKQVQEERQKTVAELQRMHHFLEYQEKSLLAQMELVEKEIECKKEEHLARLEEEDASLERVIRQMEEKCQQPASDLLQDIKSTMWRYEEKVKSEKSVAFPPELKWRIWDFCDINPFLESVLRKFRAVCCTLKKIHKTTSRILFSPPIHRRGILLSGLQLKQENITLDPDTANPRLILSEDRKSVRTGARNEDLPNNPERFDACPYVLGCEGFTTGRHFWEVVVGAEEEWAVGVARRSVQRKGLLIVGPEKGIWNMGKWKDEYRVSLGDPIPKVREKPKRIRVTLNCEGGRLSFYDADTAAHLYTYPEASFSGETLQPLFFAAVKAHLLLSL